MKKVKEMLLAGVGGILVIVATLCGVKGLLFLIDERIKVTNDTSSSVEVVWLLQNHDNGTFYLSETFTIKDGEFIEDSVGFESILCVFVESEGGSFSTIVKSGDDTRTIEVSVASVEEQGNTCPVKKEKFQEGVKNGIQLSDLADRICWWR